VHAEAARFTPAFLADRAALLGKPEPGLIHRRAAATKNLAQLRPQLSWIHELLNDGRPYVWGKTMSLADCVIYHPLWVMDQLAGERVALIPEQIRQWMDRIAARGHGHLTPMTAFEAIAIAAAATPEPPLPSEPLEGDPALGETVSITPIDYGRDNPSVGTLVSIDARRMALRHVNERTGPVTVHFPRFGYTVRPVSP
jgi:Glutathione S-transferase, C-terminal domain